MFLYDRDQNVLDIYSFNGKEQKMIRYRKTQMAQDPEMKRVLEAVAFDSDIRGELPLLEFYAGQYDKTIIPMEILNKRRTHSLGPGIMDKKDKEILLDSYYFGYLVDKEIARIQDLDGLRYFLLSRTAYSSNLYGVRRLEGIIELPESLYLLQMLEQGKFSLLGDKDISEQLDLFTITHVVQINLDQVKKMDVFGITENAYERAILKAASDEKVLKKLKKNKKW